MWPGSGPPPHVQAPCPRGRGLNLKIGTEGRQEQDDGCSTRTPSYDSTPVHLTPLTPWKSREVFRRHDSCEPAYGNDRYLIFNEVLGGGMKGVVRKGYDSETSRIVAVKRIQCDKDCHVRFLEVRCSSEEVLSAEGYAPVDSEAVSWNGPLAHDLSNPYGKDVFEPGSVAGCVVIVRRGGGVSFLEKLRNAHRSRAVGVLIVNTKEEAEVYSLGDIAEAPLPSIMLTLSDGEVAVRAALENQATHRAPSNPLAVAEVCTDVQHELKICRRLRPHPHVAQVLDTWEDGGSAVLVMELCRGGRARVPPHEPEGSCTPLWLIKQMLEGVAHLHAHGICHRDLKPENMLLTTPLEEPGARLVLVDFSMASTAERMRVPCGSPRYAAPEVLSGRGYGLKRDIWSAGMVAHELLFQSHPFDGMTDQEVVYHLQSGLPGHIQSSPIVPKAVWEFLHGLLQVNTHLRPFAEEALADPCLRDAEVPRACQP